MPYIHVNHVYETKNNSSEEHIYKEFISIPVITRVAYQINKSRFLYILK